MYRIKYGAERLYPYIGALFLVYLVRCIELNIMTDDGYKDLLDGLITLDSIIIGLLGTVIPVVLSARNESEFVKYVFEKDKENLFYKYLKMTLLLALLI